MIDKKAILQKIIDEREEREFLWEMKRKGTDELKAELTKLGN